MYKDSLSYRRYASLSHHAKFQVLRIFACKDSKSVANGVKNEHCDVAHSVNRTAGDNGVSLGNPDDRSSETSLVVTQFRHIFRQSVNENACRSAHKVFSRLVASSMALYCQLQLLFLSLICDFDHSFLPPVTFPPPGCDAFCESALAFSTKECSFVPETSPLSERFDDPPTVDACGATPIVDMIS